MAVKIHQSEQSFQDEVLKEFRALGWYAVHLSPPTVPGWQDVLALKSPYGLVLELKVFDEKDLRLPARGVFTDAQLPRYLNQLPEIGDIWVSFYDKREISMNNRGEPTFKYNLISLPSRGHVVALLEDRLDEVLFTSISFLTCEGMVKFITQTTRGIAPF